MTVFEAFPNGLEAWKIGTMSFGTITGNTITNLQTINVLADEVQNTLGRDSRDATDLDSDTLIYCQPSELPTTDPAELIASYAVADPRGRVYDILDASKGKNHETGELEHIELIVRQTATVINIESES